MKKLCGFLILFFIINYSDAQQDYDISLDLVKNEIINRYNLQDNNISLVVKINFRNKDNLLRQYDANPVFSPIFKPKPELKFFIENFFQDYLIQSGFNIQSIATNVLFVTVQQFDLNYLSGNGWVSSVNLDIELKNSNSSLFNQTAKSFYKLQGSGDDFSKGKESINNAFLETINDIEWDKIMQILTKHDKVNLPNGNAVNSGNNLSGQVNISSNNGNNSNIQQNKNILNYSLSDVDINIPVNSKQNPLRFALIIGNEDYSSYQTGLSNEVNVSFAQNDATIFKQYAINVLGVPDENIILLINAKAIEMTRAINKLNLYSKNSFGKAEIIFYYAGHGLPDETTKEPYLIPVDVSSNDLQFAVKISDLFSKLTEHPTKNTTVILDACFSGGARNQGLVAARGVKIKAKENQLKGNLIVFTASSGEQSSLPYKEKQHGLFTYYFLKKLQETKGNLTYQEMSDYLIEHIGINSVRINNKEQNPQINSSPAFENSWQSLKFGN